MPSVKCVDCGFLAVRDEYNDDVCEATDLARKRGAHKSSQGNSTEAAIFCYANSDAFKGPCAARPSSIASVNGSHPIVDVISEERECSSFCSYWPGESPREHHEMNLLAEVDRRTVAWREEASQDAERRHREVLEWQKQVEERIEERHSESERKIDSRQRRTLIVQSLPALLAAVVALIAARLLPWFGQ